MPIIVKTMEISPGNVIIAHQVEVQKKKFSYSKDKKTFTQIPYPVDDAIEFYQNSEGIANVGILKKADLVWGPNMMSVPIPQFLEIYKEHVVAPFFVFQLFTTCLWLLDDYWYFSLMQLWMLFFFEGTTAGPIVEQLLFRVEFGAALLQFVRQLVQNLGRLVLKLRFLQEGHDFFLRLRDLHLQFLLLFLGCGDLVFLEHVDDLLKLVLAVVDLLGSLEHVLAAAAHHRVRPGLLDAVIAG